jgi:alanine dehydrogenase
MRIGVPKEIKSHEYRVGMLPVGVEEMRRGGHTVLVQRGAGLGSGIQDHDYERAGATLVEQSGAVWKESELVIKVKEPQPEEYPLLQSGQMVFTYFHFAANESLTRAVLTSRATALAYETLRDTRGRLPLLTPMSEVAGRMSIQEGAKYLERPQQGRGILLGGVPGVEPARVLVLGGGVVGSNAARVAAGFGAQVTVLDIDLDRLRYLDEIMPKNVVTLFSDRHIIREQLARADLVIGAALVAGAPTPRLIEAADLKRMSSGAVLVDVAIDQGGCAETSRPTTHAEPTYVVDGVVHYCVTNIPGAVARTSSYALCNATLPYALRLAARGLRDAAREDPGLAASINTFEGQIRHPAVAAAFGLEYRPFAP